MIYLDEEQVRGLLRWEELIPAMEQALAKFSQGKVVQPVRGILTIEDGKRYLGIMPAAAEDVMGLKAVSFYPTNEGSAVPTHQAIVLLFRTDNGEPLAVMDGRLITEMRTAAVSAAITKYLMPPQSRVLALLGSGVQAHSHLAALSTVAQFEEVRVWSRTPQHAEEFAREHGAVAMEAEAAVRGADVIVVATSSQEPVLRGAWLKDGAHVNAVGANRPTWRELDDGAMRHLLVVDSREAVLQESGDVILSGANIYAEIGEIFGGAKPACPGETTIFKSVGIATEDLAAARLVYDAYNALAKGD
jgi:thiomorpholine-carboxylate dehydrogenase